MSQNNKKYALRKTLLERRDALSYDMINVCEKQICRHLPKIPQYSKAKTLACYFATGSEVPTREIILDARSLGCRVCLPRVHDDTLEFAIVNGPSDLVEGKFGIMEPSTLCDVCAKPDIALIPAVGVSLDGARLGRGRGYYDRFLAGFAGVSVVLAFSVQVVRTIPEDSWDRRVSWVVTEDGASIV